MSDLRKWMKIIESVPAIFPDQPTKQVVVKKDATVMLHPSIGGGTGRFMHSTPNGGMIDIKGITRELGHDQFSLPERDYEDGYEKGNDWFHMTQGEATPGTMNDKPEFRQGDIVKIADVYGTVIGPGMGVFIAYSTSGQEAIVSFDNKELVLPIANIGAAYEQNAKDEFDKMDNDGNLSTLSFGSDNVKIDQPITVMSIKEPEMDRMNNQDEFQKWISTVEEALSGEQKPVVEEMDMAECGCGNWDCDTCFPAPGAEEGHEPIMSFGPNEPLGPVVGEHGGTCPMCGHQDGHQDGLGCDSGEEEFEIVPVEGDDDHFGQEFESGSGGGMGAGGMANYSMEEEPMEMDEEPEKFIEKPKSGKGVKLGDIVHKTEFRPTGGQESPLSQAEHNLEGTPVDEEPEGFSDMDDYFGDDNGEVDGFADHNDKYFSDKALPDIDSADFGHDGIGRDAQPQEPTGPAGHGDKYEEDEKSQMIASVEYMQNLGLSKSDQHYSVEQLAAMDPAQLQQVRDQVMGTTTGPSAPSSGMDEDTMDFMEPVPAPANTMRDLMNCIAPESDKSSKSTIEGPGPGVRESRKPVKTTKIVESYTRLPKRSLLEQLKWDEEVKEELKQLDLNEEFELEESSLSQKIGKHKGGKNLIKWMHRNHLLSNDAELIPHPADSRGFWKQYKRNPDDFIVVVCTNGVAGIKPSQEYYDYMVKRFREKYRKEYEPAGDSGLQYQIVAFTDDGKQIDPKLLKTPEKEKPAGDEEGDDKDQFITHDPTVMKARMGMTSGPDMQNKNNMFERIRQQLGNIIAVYTIGYENVKYDKPTGQIPPKPKGAVERNKIAHRAAINKQVAKPVSPTAGPKAPLPVEEKAGGANGDQQAAYDRYAGIMKQKGLKPPSFDEWRATKKDFKHKDWIKSGKDKIRFNRPVPMEPNAHVGADTFKKQILAKLRKTSILKNVVARAYSDVSLALMDAVKADHEQNVIKLNRIRKDINEFKQAIDTNKDIPMWGIVGTVLDKALGKMIGARPGTNEYREGLEELASQNATALFPVVENLEDALIGAIDAAAGQ